ncbi:hypothetical protein [Mesorhizobium wenxiniae]|uniref:Integrase n=1 Tax=Mesorhizobium wenxiniae TaxID=2014805 RepID=A0A271KJV8_9HYPH|nr:hypothetical protein [Mesorhizobium wenxiniae]PAP96121.1 hypothetical protein CIT31_05375 [Mesorhizobium wenxiniae]
MGLMPKEFAQAANLAPNCWRGDRSSDEICDSKFKNRKRSTLPFALMERKHVLEIRDELRSTPGAQNDIVKVISAMFGWAVDNAVAP